MARPQPNTVQHHNGAGQRLTGGHAKNAYRKVELHRQLVVALVDALALDQQGGQRTYVTKAQDGQWLS